MKKKSLLVTILLLLITVFAFSLTACNNEVGTLETLKNEYGIVVDGGSFEEGSILITEEIKTDTVEVQQPSRQSPTRNMTRMAVFSFLRSTSSEKRKRSSLRIR